MNVVKKKFVQTFRVLYDVQLIILIRKNVMINH